MLSPGLLSPITLLFSSSILSPLCQLAGKFIQSRPRIQALWPSSHQFPTYTLCYNQSRLHRSLLSISSHLWNNAFAYFFFLDCSLLHCSSQIPLAVNEIIPWPSAVWGSLFYFYMLCVPPQVIIQMFWLLRLFEYLPYHTLCFRL